VARAVHVAQRWSDRPFEPFPGSLIGLSRDFEIEQGSPERVRPLVGDATAGQTARLRRTVWT